MIHILKSRFGYRVRYCGKNGEILAVSEVLKSRDNAWENVKAMVRLFAVNQISIKAYDGSYRLTYVDMKFNINQIKPVRGQNKLK